MRTAWTFRRSVMARIKARMALFRRRNSRLHAGRHIGAAFAEILLGVLGIGIIFGLLLPAIGWSSLARMEIDLSWLGVTLPEWLRWTAWSRFTLPDWLKAILTWTAPVAIAIAVTVRELRRPRRSSRTS